MLRIPYAFLRHAGLPFAYGFVSEGTIRGEFHNGGSGFRRYLFFGARSRSAFSLDSIGRERAQRRPGEARLTQNVLAADRVDRVHDVGGVEHALEVDDLDAKECRIGHGGYRRIGRNVGHVRDCGCAKECSSEGAG